ncbi:MAG: sigma-70 family RNA polymerase sigma factor [Verrucomicrobiota bacterium]
MEDSDELTSENQLVSDQHLVAQVLEGDVSCFDELILRYQERLYAVIYNMTSNHEDTNDLLMETFDKAFRSLSSYRRNASFYTWIYRIAVNRTLNHIRKNKKLKKNMSLNDVDLDIANQLEMMDLAKGSNPESVAVLTDLQKKLNESMQKLSEEHRAVVVLHDIEGLSHRDIAEIMDCTEGTVRSRLHYAHKNLQKYLSKIWNEKR